jgi:hypothetical protein
MKKDRLITIFVVSIPVLLVSMYFISLLIYKSQWNYTFSETQMQEWVDEINTTPTLGENFYSIFDILKKHDYKRTLNIEYLSLVKFHFTGQKSLHREGGRNFYLETANILVNTFPDEINTLLNPKLVLAYGLKKKVDLKKCIDFYYFNKESILFTDSLRGVHFKGIEEFSKIFFKKSIYELSDKEIIVSLSVFDQISNKDTITQELIEIKQRTNEHFFKNEREKLEQ